MSVVYGEGFGRTYVKPTSSTTKTGRRKEVTVNTIVGGQQVTMIMRDAIVPYDPYLVLVRAAAYQRMKGGPFPVPRTPRSIKDFLIRTNIAI